MFYRLMLHAVGFDTFAYCVGPERGDETTIKSFTTVF